jgi:hypothetical protein
MGMAKNTGKTTTLNHLVSLFSGYVTALTSIGLDGEAIDQITMLPKPDVRVKPGMLVATAQACLEQGDAKVKILELIGGDTPLGRIAIARVESAGRIVLAGPVTNTLLDKTIRAFEKAGATKVLVDGAFDRKTFSGLSVFDGIVLATGAALSPDMETVIDKTRRMAMLYSLPVTSWMDTLLDVPCQVNSRSGISVVPDKDPARLKETIIRLGKTFDAVSFKGAFTTRMAHALIATRASGYTLVIDDPSKWVAGDDALRHLISLGCKIEVRRRIPLLLVTTNPFSPVGTRFDARTFEQRMKDALDIPVVDVLRKETYYQKSRHKCE